MHIKSHSILRLFAAIFRILNDTVIEFLSNEHALSDKIGESNPKKLVISYQLSLLKQIIDDHQRTQEINKVLCIGMHFRETDLISVTQIVILMIYISREYLNYKGEGRLS